jgi:MFS family permease
MTPPTDRESKIWPVIRVSSGNFLEMYDFMVFGYYASAIGNAFFPNGNPFLSLMLSLMTFGAGFLMRPLGAIVLGAYTDRHGRRAGLILTLGLMSIGIISIACMPGYKTIGLLAPLLVLIGRLLQGFSAGMELGGVSVYLSEIATPGHKGFYVSWQSASQQVAVMFAALVGVILHSSLPQQKIMLWGWRIPLLLGCAILPFLYRLRRSLQETGEFAARKRRPSTSEILRSLTANWRIVLIGTMMVTMTTVSFYMITAYTPTFGSSVLHLANLDSLIVTLCVGASNLFWLPVMGALSDRVGRRPLLLLCTTLMLITAYPVMLWLAAAPSSRDCSSSNSGCLSSLAATTVPWSFSSQRSCPSMCGPQGLRLPIAWPLLSSVDLLRRSTLISFTSLGIGRFPVCGYLWLLPAVSVLRSWPSLSQV